MEYAPIMVSVYNRSVHFRKCIESLQKNTLAGQSHLFVAIDAPYAETHREAHRLVVEYAKSIDGFKEVTLLIRESNLGAIRNRMLAREEIFSKYDRMIMFEDDNVFSPDFLSFVNKGLECYEKRDDIFSVSGYNYPIVMPADYRRAVYVWTGFSAWGVGIWKEKWKKFNWSLAELDEVLSSRKEKRALNHIAEHYLSGLRLIKETGHVTGDTLISLYHFKNNLYSVFPAVSRVRNIGHDGSGIHCGVSDLYANQQISTGIDDAEMPVDLQPDPMINKVLREHFRISRTDKVKINLKLALKSMGMMKKQTSAAN